VKIDSLPDIQISEKLMNIVKIAVEKTLIMENCEDCEVSVFITDDQEIHKLNKLYRDSDRPTDVLAFAMREGMDNNLNRDILGDVVISLTTAERQANIYNHSLEEEISLLASHGVLHLLGYEHEKEDETLIMQNKQERILSSMGYKLKNTIIKSAD
jgi:probable rRNA maturation factor